MAENDKTKATPVKEDSRERKALINEIKELNDSYKQLVQRKQVLTQELNKVDEEILKKVGAFNTIKKLIDKLDKDDAPKAEAPEKETPKEPKVETPAEESPGKTDESK